MIRALPLFSLLLSGASPALGFTQSRAQVTPDARFSHPVLAEKWPHISLEEARRLHGLEGVVFVDGRSYVEWEESRIPGSVALPTGEFNKRYATSKARLRKAKVIVAYCHGEGCRLADTLAEYLVSKGHRNVAVFWGGHPAWKKAGLKMEGKGPAKKKGP